MPTAAEPCGRDADNKQQDDKHRTGRLGQRHPSSRRRQTQGLWDRANVDTPQAGMTLIRTVQSPTACTRQHAGKSACISCTRCTFPRRGGS